MKLDERMGHVSGKSPVNSWAVSHVPRKLRNETSLGETWWEEGTRVSQESTDFSHGFRWRNGSQDVFFSIAGLGHFRRNCTITLNQFPQNFLERWDGSGQHVQVGSALAEAPAV